MKKSLITLLVLGLISCALFVSCNSEVTASQGDSKDLVSVSFDGGDSKSLTATLEGFDKNAYYWKYAALKNVSDTSGLTSGETASYDEDGAVFIHEATPGLTGKVSGFSQGVWDFKLFAYKRSGAGTNASPYVYNHVYTGEATGVTLKKGSENLVSVTVSPYSTGTGTLFIDSTTLTPKTSTDVPSVSRYLKVQSVGSAEEKLPTSGTTYTLDAGAYLVTVTYKSNDVVFAEGTVIATVYPNLTTTVGGSVDELITYAQFDAVQNPDIITKTAGLDGITSTTEGDADGNIKLTEASTVEDKKVEATVPVEAAKALLPQVGGNPDPNASMSLALNVDTVDSTSTSVTYEISMTKVVTVDSEVSTSDVTNLGEDENQNKYYAVATIKLSTGLTGVVVKHDGHDMVNSESTTVDEGYGVYSYNATTGILTIQTNTFSPFAVTYDGLSFGVAEVNGVKYSTLVAACDALPNEGGTIKMLCDTEGAGIFLPANLNMNIVLDMDGYTYTCTGPAVGSTGTATQALHLEKNNTVTVKNGTITATPDSGVKMLVQNYCDLTLTDVTLDGRNIGEGRYTLSNNNGTVNINGNTSFIAPPDGIAFDVCSGWGGYTSCVVNLNTSGTINGNIEVADYKLNTEGVYLNIDNAILIGDIVVPEWTDKIHINKVCYNADTNVWYDDLQAAINVATAGDTIVMVKDVSLNSVLLVGKSVTIQGRGHEIKNSANRIVRITTADCDVKIYDWTMTSTCTVGDDERGISFDKASAGSKLLLDGCSVSAGFYVINAIPGADNIEVTIKNGTIAAGWAAINCYSKDSTWTIENSTLRGLNDKGESSWNNFNTITFDGNGLWNGNVGQAGSGNTIILKNSTVYGCSDSSNKQYWLGLQYGAQSNVISYDDDCQFIDENEEDISDFFNIGYYCNWSGEQFTTYYNPNNTVGEITYELTKEYYDEHIAAEGKEYKSYVYPRSAVE